MRADDDVKTETGGLQATEVAVASWPCDRCGHRRRRGRRELRHRHDIHLQRRCRPPLPRPRARPRLLPALVRPADRNCYQRPVLSSGGYHDLRPCGGFLRVTVKLTRTLAIIPVCPGLAAVRGRHGKNATERSVARRVSIRRILPVFIVAFIAAPAANTIGLVPVVGHHALSDLSTWMITAALAAVGLSTDVHRIRRAGFRPLALGAVLWVTVPLTSLGLQALTGSF